MIRPLLCLLLVLSFSAQAGNPHKPQCPYAFGWSCPTTVAGVTGNYTPVVQMGGSQIRVYSNTDGVTDGNLYLRVGSWNSVGSATMVLDILDARDTYIRTSGITQGSSGTYYAVLYTGDGYPTTGGYSPSWATSPDGYAWTWWGPIGIFGRNQSSAAALVIDESRTDAYACMAWIDLAGGLKLMHAPMPCMPTDWTSDNLNMWPIAGEQPQFVSAAKDQYGYHLVGANTYPATALRHVFSCDGLTNWQVLETKSPVGQNNYKGTNLVVDAPNNLLHAMTSGVHYSLPIRAYSC